MILRLWLRGKILRSFAEIAAASIGIALTVTFIVTLASFLAAAKISMTSRAISVVSLDWQVQAEAGAEVDDIGKEISETDAVETVHRVRYLDAAGFEARTGQTTQRTGPGQVVTIDETYLKDFPAEMRMLSGDASGILIAQQTAANLHIAPGGTVTIERTGLAPVSVKVSGVVDLPDADALFQAVGKTPDAGPQAPPDNVLIFPPSERQQLFLDGVATPLTERNQWHIRLGRANLPADPVSAFAYVTSAERNLESRLAGRALVADNLAARLDAVREDALYATVLFLFLGAPGIALAAALSFAVVAAGGARRRREQALLRVRGASPATVVALAIGEALVAGGVGAATGVLFAALLAFSAPGLEAPGQHPRALFAAILVGVLLAIASYVPPAWRNARGMTVNASRLALTRPSPPLWKRLWLDVALLAIAAFFFWQSESTGYQIVLATEGVAATSVDYKAFVAPALSWISVTLLVIRVCSYVIRSNGPILNILVSPFSGRLAPIVAATLSRQSTSLAVGIAATAVAIAFAASTAVFNATYEAQARLDAQLTNGSDVTVFGTVQSPAGAYAPALAAIPGVEDVEPMQHRFAYVGTDLQDLFGIDADRIGRVAQLSGTFFSDGDADVALRRLASTPNGVLVSEETVQDFQLQEGDDIKLRLMNSADHQYQSVGFKFVGVVREFPTAPRDSFLVANAAYVAASTGSPQEEYVLMLTVGDPAAVASRVRAELGADPSLKVTDIGQAAQLIGSSLVAVDLRSLTMIELGFAVLTAAGAAGLIFVLSILERRRSFAILHAIGAKPKQLGAFLWSEGLVTFVGGSIFGLLWGFSAAWVLVKLLTGIFDPPPDALVVPWAYLATVVGCVAASIAAAIVLVMSMLRIDVGRLRDL